MQKCSIIFLWAERFGFMGEMQRQERTPLLLLSLYQRHL